MENAQRFDSHHGRTESYWSTRNALVDAVHAARGNWDAWSGQEAPVAYLVALDALKAFDTSHGGTPVL